MPSPPLSPIPRRINTPSMADLLSSLERSSEGEWLNAPERQDRDAGDEGEVDHLLDVVPEIRTISPSPQRRRGSPTAHSDEGRLSPLSARGSGRTFGSPGGSLRYNRDPSPTSHARAAPPSNQVQQPHMQAQSTGQSVTTIDQAFADIRNTLDQLASGGPNLSLNPIASAPASTRPMGLGITTTDGSRLFPDDFASRLEAVTEQTEPSTASRSNRSTPSPTFGQAMSSGSIAKRFPLPATPLKGSRGGSTTQGNQISPTKRAADLIKMFENKSDVPSNAPVSPSRTGPPMIPANRPILPVPLVVPQLGSLTSFPPPKPFLAHDQRPVPLATPPPSSYRPPALSGFEPPMLNQPSPENVEVLTPARSRSPSPASSPGAAFKSLVASWRSRAGSPAQRVVGSPGKGGDTPRLFRGREGGWNVSIRRRKRDDADVGLAERAEEPPTSAGSYKDPPPSPTEGSRRDAESIRSDVEAEAAISPMERAGSNRSAKSYRSHGSSASAPLITGEAIKAGTLWYLNVHDATRAPNFVWIQADARLFPNGLQLAWRTETGGQAMVTFDMEFCEEVASTYSPNHPLAEGDMGAMAARRQGNLAEDLYPFKLVYDDGTERLACESSRERVRWVNAIWTGLEQTRGPRHSLHVQRPTSIFSSSDGGSATTHRSMPTAAFQTTVTLFPVSVDDGVITSPAGLPVSLAHRDSRRLVAGGMERARSLRRVASEADLSDSVGHAEHLAWESHSAHVPLTADVARSRPVSRDFTFAGGQAPPVLSPPPQYASPIPPLAAALSPQHTTYTTAHTAPSSSAPSYHTPASQYSSHARATTSYHTFGIEQDTAVASSASTYQPLSPTATMYTAAPSASTVRPMSPSSGMYTALLGTTNTRAITAVDQPMSATGTLYTADPESVSAVPTTSYFTPRAPPSLPSLAITDASPRPLSQVARSSYNTAEGGTSFHTASNGLASSVYDTAAGSAYGTAPAQLGSPFVLGDPAKDRSTKGSLSSVSSYASAPPPVPSRNSYYSTAIAAESTVVRYQLHDRPMSVISTTTAKTAPLTIEDQFYTVQTSQSSSTSASYTTAPAVPRSLSFSSDIQEQAETATYISEPDTDADLIADLERRSSAGSLARPIQRRPAQTRSRTYDTTTSQAYTLARDGGRTIYETAHESAYTTAPSWHISSYYTAPDGGGGGGAPSSKPSSISTAQSTAQSRIRRVPLPSLPPPTPSEPSSDPSSQPTTAAPSYTSDGTAQTRAGLGYDLNRMMNYLQGQDDARQGQTTRLATQLDRIEGKVSTIADQMGDRPPPLPSKGPRSRSSSTSSVETARPVTPPAYIVPQTVTDRLDDMQRLLGQLVGQNRDLMDEVARRRSYDVELPGGPQKRLEEMMRHILRKLDGDMPLEEGSPPPSPGTEYTKEGSMYEGTGSAYTETLGGKGRRAAPPPSFTSSYKQRKRFSGIPNSLLDPSLGDPEFEEDFAMRDLPPHDPPTEHVIPHVQIPPHLARHRRQQSATTPMPHVPTPIPEEPEYEDSIKSTPVIAPRPHQAYAETEPESPDLPPLPYRQEDGYEQRDQSVYSDEYERNPAHRLPPPRPVDLPTPVNSLKNIPLDGSSYPPPPGPGMPMHMRPGFMPPPGAMNMPRPSIPRIAGVRDPISTTYFRRGFPPPGPMGMGPMGMGMFPGPMGIPGPGMGPFMPGLRPGMGMNGLGGPIGPNVGPGMRRPGFFPPGVPANSGDYGLPAASRYGHGGPSRPGHPGAHFHLTPDTGIGNTTSESSVSSSPSATTAELVTPVTAHIPIAPTIVQPPAVPAVTPSLDTDDSFRRALDNAQTLAEAQGVHQNEMSRFLHGLSDQMTRNRTSTDRELGGILSELGRLRAELKPKHISGRVLPDGTVVLDNGDVVDGIRGAPLPGAEQLPPPPLSAPHVAGRVLPDGTVMAGDAILDGVRGAPQPEAVLQLPPQQLRDLEQDRKLADLMEKVTELMHRTKPDQIMLDQQDLLDAASIRGESATPHHPQKDIIREKTTVKEREIIREGSHNGHEHLHGSHGSHHTYSPDHRHHHHHGHHDEHEVPAVITTITTQAPPAGAITPAGGVVPIPDLAAANVPGAAGVAPVGTTTTVTKLNPRTGKPLSLPKPLSLQPQDMSPIVSENGDAAAGGALVREEHEEVIQRPGGGPPVVTKTTTRTYLNPDGTVNTTTSTNNVPPPPSTVPATTPIPVFPPPQTAGQFSDPGTLSNVPLQTVKTQKQTTETQAAGPGGGVIDTTTTTVEQTKIPAISVRPPSTVASNVPPTAGLMPVGGVANVPAVVVPGPVNGAANVPSGPSGIVPVPVQGGVGSVAPVPATTASNVPVAKPVKPVWDTNHKKPQPITSVSNVPPVTGDPTLDPASTVMPNVAPDQILLPASSAPGAVPVGTAANAAPVGVVPGKAGGVRWIPHLEVREANGPPQKTKIVPVPAMVKPGPPATTGVPTGAPIMLPPNTIANVPDGSGGVIPVVSGADPASIVPQAVPPTITTTKVDEKVKPASGGVLSKLKPSTSSSNIKTSTEGPPVVTGVPVSGGEPLNVTNGKQTRFSDTTGVAPGPVFMDPTDQTAANAGSRPGTPIIAPNKLTKPGPGSTTVANIPGGAPALAGSSTTIVPGKGGPGHTPLPAPHELEEFIMPDGTTAYIKRSERPKMEETIKTKKTEKITTPLGAAVPGMALNESAMGHGHCSVCCPSAPKTAMGQPVQPCAHQDGPAITMAGNGPAAPAAKPATKLTKPPAAAPGPAVIVPSGPDMNLADVSNIDTDPQAGVKGKKPTKIVALAPEEQKMEDARTLAIKQKAAAEQAAAEKAQRDAAHKAKADKAKLFEDRHKANQDTLSNLQKLLESIAKDQKDRSTATDKRRVDKTTRDKKFQDTLDKLIIQKDEGKKKEDENTKKEVEKTKKEKEGTQAVLDAIQKFGTQEKEFLDRLAKGILEQNSKQHEETRNAAKLHAREQVGFNLAGYLDDFSKSLSGEVRSLLHEVSGLRETRRALYYELAELLLMKGRQSSGDLMAIMPYPTKPAVNPNAKGAQPAKPAGDKGGGGGDGKAKAPGGVPAWSAWMPPPQGAMAGMPAAGPRPLPQPGMPPMGPPPGSGILPGVGPTHMFTMAPTAVPPPPLATGSRPLPMV